MATSPVDLRKTDYSYLGAPIWNSIDGEAQKIVLTNVFNNFLNVDFTGLSMEQKLQLLFISDNPVIHTYISILCLRALRNERNI